MHWRIVLGMLAGCGRVGFGSERAANDAPIDAAIVDGRACTASGHDEDADGIDDACDACPHVVDGAQLDGDGDGIGDACDPSPGIANHLVLFDPFTGPRPEWTYGSSQMFTGDALHLAGINNSVGAALVAPPTRAHYEVGAHIGAGGSGSRQIAVLIGPRTTSGAYYCELYDDGMQLKLAYTYTPDNVSFTSLDARLIPGRLQDGDARLSLMQTATTVTCLGTWAGVVYAATGPIATDIVPEVLFVGDNNLDVDLAYFVEIALP